MKTKTKSILLMIIGIVYVTLFTLTMIIFSPEVKKDGRFWLPICLTYIPNIIAIVYIFFSVKKTTEVAMNTTLLFYIFLVANAVTFITCYVIAVGLEASWLESAISKKGIVIVYIIELVAYLVAMIIASLGLNYISSNQKEVKQKVAFIKTLQEKAQSCGLTTTNEENKMLLKKLEEDIRFSDPMSHSSLEDIEAKISILLDDIQTAIDNGKEEQVKGLVEKARIQIKIRNNKCLNLKQ